MAPSREDELLGQRVTPFLTKTYHLVDDHSTDDVVSWNSDGTSFVVWRPAEFARDILPLFFKHNNLSSFVRQLNTYAFRKISDRWEFTHASFRRGEKRLLKEIRRRQRFSLTPAGLLVNGDASPTNSSEEQATSSDTAVNCNGSTQLEEENTRLRKENRRLSEELGRMKKVCNYIFNLVSDLKSTEVKGDAGSSGPTGPLPLLDLMPAEALVDNNGREGCSTKLFGVSILAKPSRNVVHGDDMDLDLNPRTLDLAGPAEPVQSDESSFI